jgi:hypothetical protein
MHPPPMGGDLVRLHYKSVRNSQPPQFMNGVHSPHEWVLRGYEWVFVEALAET